LRARLRDGPIGCNEHVATTLGTALTSGNNVCTVRVSTSNCWPTAIGEPAMRHTCTMSPIACEETEAMINPPFWVCAAAVPGSTVSSTFPARPMMRI